MPIFDNANSSLQCSEQRTMHLLRQRCAHAPPIVLHLICDLTLVSFTAVRIDLPSTALRTYLVECPQNIRSHILKRWCVCEAFVAGKSTHPIIHTRHAVL